MTPVEDKGLKRELSLTHATVLNMIDMVGIGPFVALPIILIAFPGKFSLIPWLIGAALALGDGLVWSELGAAWPKAGGSYIFLQKLFRGKPGKVMSFLYVVQTTLHTPLVITSACIGFVNYLRYFEDLSFIQGKMVMIGIVLMIVFFLYRKVIDVGKIGIALSIIVVTLLLWTIITGAIAFDTNIYLANSATPNKLGSIWSIGFWYLAGNASTKAIYSYLGYYNVCHIGSEIKNPVKNIPRSIMLSVVGIAILYISMQFVISGAVEQKVITSENVPLISMLFQKVYGTQVATIATIMLLVVAFSSLFALLLGYSRIIWAAANEGMHFKVFAHLHPTKNFPDYALLIFGGIAIIFCMIFNKASDVFKFIVVTRIFIQFIPQSIGVILMRINKRQAELPYKMALFPFLIIISILIWLYVFISSGIQYSLFGLGVIGLGLGLYWALFNSGKK
jgi:fructoselysine transporter